jgi:hypothetical protein
VRRFFRTPKGLLTIALAILTVLAAPHEGLARVLPGLTAALAAAMLVDAPILRLRGGHWEFPSGAMLTGWIVALVLSPHEAWWLAPVTSILAVISKYLFRYRTANVFNPAALALVVTFYVFDTGQSWWGALPEITPDLHGHDVCRRPGARGGDLHRAGPACRAVLRVLHPDRSANVTDQARRPGDLRRDHRHRQLRRVRVARRRTFSPGRRTRRESVGTRAPGSRTARLIGVARGLFHPGPRNNSLREAAA